MVQFTSYFYLRLNMIVIFIAGASASGKTTLSDMLKSHFVESLNRTCEVLRMDDYFKEAPEGCDIANYKATTNFTKLETRDLDLLANQILTLNDGNSILQPEYSFVTCKRSMTKTLHAPEFLIVEGTFVLHFANVMPSFKDVFNTQLSHIGIFVSQSDYEETLKRRIIRNGVERGQSEDVVRRLDEQYLRPAFLNIMLPSAQTADKQIINDNCQDPADSIDTIMEVLSDRLGVQYGCRMTA